jgi:tetratricopeptide (TPR) repeat protein
MRMRFHLLVAATLVVALGGLGCAKVRAKAAFQDGNRAYTEEDFRQAIEEYEAVIQLDPSLAAAYFYLGSSHQALYRPNREGDPENDAHLSTAVDQYKKTLEVTTSGGTEAETTVRMNAMAALTAIYSEEPFLDFDGAVSYAEELVKEKPDDTANLFAMANLYEKFDEIDMAEQTYVRAAEVDPSDIRACGALASFYNKPLWDGRSKFEEAIAALGHCASLAPDDAKGFYKVATFYWDKAFRDPMLDDEQKEQYADLGLEAVDTALSLDPSDVDALVYKGLLYRVKAQVSQDPRERYQFLDQAETLQARALELREQQDAESAGGVEVEG